MALVAYKSWAVDDTGAVIANADIEVRARDGADPVTIYSDASGTAQTNPYEAGSDGSFSFWAEAGKYDVRVGPAAAPAVKPVTLTDPFANAVTPLQFGAKGDGTTDDTTAVRACHVFANSNLLPVTYAGMASVLIDADAQIVVNTSTDGAGCTLVARNGLNGTPASGTVNTMFVVQDDGTPVVEGSVTSITADMTDGSTSCVSDFAQSMGFAYLQGTGDGPVIPLRNSTTETQGYGQSFAVQREGRTTQPLSWDLSTETTFDYKYRAMPSNGRLVFKGFTVDAASFNNQCIVEVQRNGTTVSDMFFAQADGSLDPDTINNLIQLSQVAYVDILRITGTAQTTGGDNGGTYWLNAREYAEVRVDSCTGMEGWGAIGTNDGNGFTITNCSLNRVDAHAGGHNIFVDGCTIYNHGVLIGWGGGVVSIRNCKFVDAPFVQIRADYSGFFFGDFIIEGNECSNRSFVQTIFDATSNPIGGPLGAYPIARSIVIADVNRTDLDNQGNNREVVPVSITVDTSSGNLAPLAPSNIRVSGVTCAGNWRMNLPVDYQNMTLPSDTDGCHLTVKDVKPNQVLTSGTGIYIPANVISGAGDYDLDIRVEECTKVSINVAEHSRADFYAYNSDICRPSTPNGRICEINGGTLTSPDLQGAETHVVVGGTATDEKYTTLRDVKVLGIDASSGWDFSNVHVMDGVDIANVTENSGTIYPTGCDRRQALFGWSADATDGDFTVTLTDASGNTSATTTPAFYHINQGVAQITISSLDNMDATGMTSGDAIRITIPVTAKNSADFEQYVSVQTQQLPLYGQYFVKSVANQSYLEFGWSRASNTGTMTWADVSGLGAEIRGFTINVVL